MLEKINENQKLVLQKISNTDNPLAKLIKDQRQKNTNNQH